MKPASRLGSAFETLEDRALPTAFGVPWADPEHLTFSFASDGTQTPLGTSSLSQVLASAGTSAAWKTEILRAFQTWAANANINIGLVSDGGQALGATGAVQGDSRFGDIRVAAAGLSPDVLASTSPFSFTGTTLSGEMVLNSNAPFGIGGGAGYDLYSVALHEAGHSLGLDHDHEPEASAIHETYERQVGLSATDVAHLQALYGARTPDAFEGARGNNTAATAAAIPRASATQLLATADLSTGSDVDFFKFSAPALTSMIGAVTVRLKTEGLSLLTAKVTVFDSVGRVVAADASTDPLNNDLQLSFRPGLFGGNYTIKVEGARGDVFDVGAYKVAVDFLSIGGTLTPLTTTLGGALDGHTDDALANALGLQTNSGADSRFDAVYRGVIEDTRDVDTYRVHTDKFALGALVTMNVMVWGLDANAVDPRVRVYDTNGNPVAFQVLSNDRGLFSVQVLNAVAGRDYFVQVSAREGAAKATGSYFVAADFNRLAPLVFDGVANGTAAVGAADATGTLALSEAGLFQFALGARSATAGDAVTMYVYDASGNAVFSLTAVAGRPLVTAAAYLKAGSYTVRYAGARTNGAAADYDLFMMQLSEGVGPYASSTASPSSSTAPSSDSTTGTQPSSTTTTSSSSTTTTSQPTSTTTTSSSSTPTTSSSSTPTTSTTSSPPPSTSKSYSYSGQSTSRTSGEYYTY